MAQRLHWPRDGSHWPHHERSRFVDAAGVRWHVQAWEAPRPGAPQVLLIHGTGASTHSWRDVAPLLATDFRVLACDLPGHAFSGPARGEGAGLRGMARGLAALLATLGFAPDAIAGHSAGAAIAIRMALDADAGTASSPPTLIGLNAALMPLQGFAGLFAPAAKLLALNTLVPPLVSWQAAEGLVFDRLLGSTGSQLDAPGREFYRRLVADPGHVAGVLAMMARWDLPTLYAELPRLRAPLHLVVADKDGTVPPADAERIRQRVPQVTVHRMREAGHLAHEERPAEAAALIKALVTG